MNILGRVQRLLKEIAVFLSVLKAFGVPGHSVIIALQCGSSSEVHLHVSASLSVLSVLHEL